MINEETNQPHTAHTCNPVPFIITGEKGALEVTEEKGSLADVAPTILAIMVSVFGRVGGGGSGGVKADGFWVGKRRDCRSRRT